MSPAITLMQLEIFHAVATTGSTVKAAQMLYTSQSSISKTLSRLEENLGYPLFERQRGKIALTDAGNVFSVSVSRILQDLDDSIREAQQVHASSQPNLHLAGSSYLLHDLVKHFHTSQPGIHFNLQFQYERFLKQLLHAREVSLVLSTSPDNWPASTFRWIPLISCEILAAIPAHHPLAKQPVLTMQSLKHEEFVCNNIGINGDFIRNIFKSSGISKVSLLECNENTVFEEYIDSSNRFTFIPSYAVHIGNGRESTVERRISDLTTRQEYGFVCHRDDPLPDSLRDFVDASIQYCTALSECTQKHLLTLH